VQRAQPTAELPHGVNVGRRLGLLQARELSGLCVADVHANGVQLGREGNLSLGAYLP